MDRGMNNDKMDRWIDADLPVHSGRLGHVDLPPANWVVRCTERWMHRFISGQTDIIDVYIFTYN